MYTTINTLRATGECEERLAVFAKHFRACVPGSDNNTWFVYTAFAYAGSNPGVDWAAYHSALFAPGKVLYVNGVRTTGEVLNRVARLSSPPTGRELGSRKSHNLMRWNTDFCEELTRALPLTGTPRSSMFGHSCFDFLITEKLPSAEVQHDINRATIKDLDHSHFVNDMVEFYRHVLTPEDRSSFMHAIRIT